MAKRKVELSGDVEAVSGKAILFNDGDTESWIPLSQISEVDGSDHFDSSDFKRGQNVTIEVPEWLALNGGFI